MLYSVAGGSLEPWAEAQMVRFGVGIVGHDRDRHDRHPLLADRWRRSPTSVSLVLLVAVDVMGVIGMGAQRWIDLGPIQIQPSEMMKIALVMALAAYYALARPGEGLAPLLGAPAAPADPDAGRRSSWSSPTSAPRSCCSPAAAR